MKTIKAQKVIHYDHCNCCFGGSVGYRLDGTSRQDGFWSGHQEDIEVQLPEDTEIAMTNSGFRALFFDGSSTGLTLQQAIRAGKAEVIE